MRVKVFREESGVVENSINLWIESFDDNAFTINQISHSTFQEAGREMSSVIVAYTESQAGKKKTQPKNKGPVGRYL